MAYNTAGPFGTTSGTSEGPGTASHTDSVTKIIAYSTSAYIFGIKLFWGATNVMYGSTHDLNGEVLDLTDDFVKEIKYHIDATGVMRGMRFRTSLGTIMSIGYLNDNKPIAFSGATNHFTDLVTYKGTVGGDVVIWGATFYYTGPAYSLRVSTVQRMACPALAVMAHTMVVAKSLMKVGKLRGELNIKAPSCDPPAGTDPAKVQLWHRTWRAQENCKEMFLVYLPSILIASTMGHEAFGKWVPHAVGAFSLVGAFFRYKYLNAYIEDADKRGKPFKFAGMCMKPVFLLAVVSCGYLVGKQIYCCYKNGCCKSGCNKSCDDEDEQ